MAGEKSIIEIWSQTKIPVVYRAGKGKPLMLRLPYANGNREWLKNDRRRNPEWMSAQKYWKTPNAWFDDIITRSLRRFGRIYIIQPFRVQEKCAPACWAATGFECECSCMGEYHGSENPTRGWKIISETFAVRWRGRELACRLIQASGSPIEIGIAP